MAHGPVYARIRGPEKPLPLAAALHLDRRFRLPSVSHQSLRDELQEEEAESGILVVHLPHLIVGNGQEGSCLFADDSLRALVLPCYQPKFTDDFTRSKSHIRFNRAKPPAQHEQDLRSSVAPAKERFSSLNGSAVREGLEPLHRELAPGDLPDLAGELQQLPKARFAPSGPGGAHSIILMMVKSSSSAPPPCTSRAYASKVSSSDCPLPSGRASISVMAENSSIEPSGLAIS